MDCGYGVLVKGIEEKIVCPKKRTVFGGNMNEEEIVELAVCGLHMALRWSISLPGWGQFMTEPTTQRRCTAW